jgi:hypothetical protein
LGGEHGPLRETGYFVAKIGSGGDGARGNELIRLKDLNAVVDQCRWCQTNSKCR